MATTADRTLLKSHAWQAASFAGDCLYSLKTFAAAMLALYLSFAFGLSKPAWAMGSVYLVSQPLAGATGSKAIFRMLGTLLGATAAVVLVPNLVDAPLILSAALAAWTGLCLYLSLLDRTPRSYVFLLAGYTAAIIGFPSVGDPASIFMVAVARVEEIGLAIVCATVIGLIVLPRDTGPQVAERLRTWMMAADRLAVDSLAADTKGVEIAGMRRQLAADAADLQGVMLFLNYDPSAHSGIARRLKAVHDRMILMLPTLAAIRDRFQFLRGEGTLPAGFEALAAKLVAWIGQGVDAPPALAHEIRDDIARLEPADPTADGWQSATLTNLCQRLSYFMDLREDCIDLWLAIREGRRTLARPPRYDTRAVESVPLHADHGLAARIAVAVTVSISAVCAVWIVGGWTWGANAAIQVAVYGSVVSAIDNPWPRLRTFIFATLIALVILFVYQFGILPKIDGFAALVVALAPLMLPLGVMMSSPTWGTYGFVILVSVVLLLGLQNNYPVTDLPSFLNANIASLFGMLFVAAVVRTVRTLDPAQAARRLTRAGLRDLMAVAAGHTREGRDPFTRRMIDRVGLIVPRLTGEPRQDDAAEKVFADLMAAGGLEDLAALRARLPPEAGPKIDRLFSTAEAHFRARLADRPPPSGTDALSVLDDILACLTAHAATTPKAVLREAVAALVGFRRAALRSRAPAPARTAIPASTPLAASETH